MAPEEECEHEMFVLTGWDRIDERMHRIREAVRPYPKPALFPLANQGFNTPFEQLVACVISIRTRDEVTEPVAGELFGHARTPTETGRLVRSNKDWYQGGPDGTTGFDPDE
jgi:endonuclease III